MRRVAASVFGFLDSGLTAGERWRRLRERADVRQNPWKALTRRLVWRARWALRNDPWRVHLEDGTPLLVQKGGAGAMVYFQQTVERETTAFLNAFLRPGMVFVDAGAHFGEYTLRASRLVGDSGEVHAFEPCPEVMELLQRNVADNRAVNVTVNGSALFERDETVPFRVEKEWGVSSIHGDGEAGEETVRVIPVEGVRLDSYWRGRPRQIDLIKADVEGAELSVLRGASGLASRPVWIFESSAANYAHFGYGPRDIVRAFREQGYGLWVWEAGRCIELEGWNGLERDANLIAAPEGVSPLNFAGKMGQRVQ